MLEGWQYLKLQIQLHSNNTVLQCKREIKFLQCILSSMLVNRIMGFQTEHYKYIWYFCHYLYLAIFMTVFYFSKNSKCMHIKYYVGKYKKKKGFCKINTLQIYFFFFSPKLAKKSVFKKTYVYMYLWHTVPTLKFQWWHICRHRSGCSCPLSGNTMGVWPTESHLYDQHRSLA